MSDKAPMTQRKPEDVIREIVAIFDRCDGRTPAELSRQMARAVSDTVMSVAEWMARPVTGAECFRRRHETVADVVNKILTARLAKLKESKDEG